jgi:uncharacterized protein (TIGR02145 family)
MRINLVICWLFFCACFFRVSGQNLRFPVSRKLLKDARGNLQTLRLVISESGNASGILFSEIHRPRPDSAENYYLIAGTGEQQTGQLPASFTHPEKWEIRVEVKTAFTKAFLPVISIPLNLICGKCWFQMAPENSARQNLRVSPYGDTLFVEDSNHFFLYSGLSTANYTRDGEINSEHSCGIGDVHNPALTYGRMKDQEGKEYKTIRIGKQEWMAENLRVSRFRNGDPIPEIIRKKEWKNTASPAFCWFNNDSALYECPYGRLYNAPVVNDSRKVCPAGWRVPDKKAWNYLIEITGGGEKAYYSLKTSGIRYWAANVYYSGANSSGFSALPGAARFKTGKFDDFGFQYGAGYYGLYWSSEKNADKQTSFGLMSEYNTENSMAEFLQEVSPECGLSIRCVRDDE